MRFTRLHGSLLHLWVRDRLNRHAYLLPTEEDLRTSRKSSTVFVFGSGYSLNDISKAEWSRIGRHDVLGLTNFIYQKWIHVDYYLLRGGVESAAGAIRWKRYAQDFVHTLNTNPCFQNTVFVLQGEYLAQFCNALVGLRYLNPGSRIFRYKTARSPGPPTQSLAEGLHHGVGALCDAVNFASCLGWTEIVLTGVDLYDNRYFWLKPDETLGWDEKAETMVPMQMTLRGIRYDQPHSTVRNGIVEIMRNWSELFEKGGVRLSVYNPRSLLAEVLPVFKWQPTLHRLTAPGSP